MGASLSDRWASDNYAVFARRNVQRREELSIVYVGPKRNGYL